MEEAFADVGEQMQKAMKKLGKAVQKEFDAQRKELDAQRKELLVMKADLSKSDVFDKPHPDPADKSALEDLVENVVMPEKKGVYKAMVGYLFEKENWIMSPTKAKRSASPLQFAPLKKKRGG